jgi:exodeoxyribonuclease VII large subunit
MAAPERSLYTVSRLNREVRLLLDNGIPVVWVEAELSNFSQPASGHWYFTLKDRDAQVRAAMFRQRNMGVGFTPKSGQQVVVRGRVGLYEPRGEYQLIVEHMEEAGVGALKREFERLKARLQAEGLFAQELKRPLPALPRRIGVITSPTGAAIRDILHILKRRFPPAQVLLYPVPVQGAAAVPALIEALQLASARAECDVLIVARGGGSIEDLWAFNDEGVARAIRASRIPVVSGVGHEIDFTIADFVADVRAPTPSGAAEIVVPDRAELLAGLRTSGGRLVQAMQRELRAATVRFTTAQRRLQLTHPGIRLQQQAQRLDDIEQRLTQAARSTLLRQNGRLGTLLTRLLQASPERHLASASARGERLTVRLYHAIESRLQRAQHRLALAQNQLHAVSPLATLSRGFAVVTRADGGLVTDAGTIDEGDEIRALLQQGALRARVTSKE